VYYRSLLQWNTMHPLKTGRESDGEMHAIPMCAFHSLPSTHRSTMAVGTRHSLPSEPRTPSSCPLSVWTTSLLPHQGSSIALKLDLHASFDLWPLGSSRPHGRGKRKRRQEESIEKPRSRWPQERQPLCPRTLGQAPAVICSVGMGGE
jgi:hypothetical protein